MAIKDAIGEWIYEETEVKEFIRNGFNDIYTISFTSVSRLEPYTTQWQASLMKEEKISISWGVSDEEIIAMLWSLKAFKAPGPDGLHVRFY